MFVRGTGQYTDIMYFIRPVVAGCQCIHGPVFTLPEHIHFICIHTGSRDFSTCFKILYIILQSGIPSWFTFPSFECTLSGDHQAFNRFKIESQIDHCIIGLTVRPIILAQGTQRVTVHKRLGSRLSSGNGPPFTVRLLRNHRRRYHQEISDRSNSMFRFISTTDKLHARFQCQPFCYIGSHIDIQIITLWALSRHELIIIQIPQSGEETYFIATTAKIQRMLCGNHRIIEHQVRPFRIRIIIRFRTVPEPLDLIFRISGIFTIACITIIECFVQQGRIIPWIEYVRQISRHLHSDIAAVRNIHLFFLTAFSCNQYYTISGTWTINCRRRGIFQERDSLNTVRIQVWKQVGISNRTIDHI